MRVIRFTTSKTLDTVEREIMNSLQFFFGWHLRDITFELDARIERNKGVVYLIRYIYNTPAGRKMGKIPQLALYQPNKGEFVILLPDEPALVMAIAHGLSQISDSLDVNIGNYNQRRNTIVSTGRQIYATPVTVNVAVNSAITSLLLNRKIEARVFAVSLSYGTYIVVYGLKRGDDPLEVFHVELELVFDEDIVEVGVDAGGHAKHIKRTEEETVKFGEEFVHIGDIVMIEDRIEKRTKH